MTKEESRLVITNQKAKDELSGERTLSKPQEQRERVQITEDSGTTHVVIQLNKEDLSKLSSLSDRTTIPLHILCQALLRQAISRYSLADGLDDLLLQLTVTPQVTSLSNREMDILKLIVQGVSNRGIASTLEVSEQTVKNHVSSILRKMKVDNRTQAAFLAFKHNLEEGRIPSQTKGGKSLSGNAYRKECTTLAGVGKVKRQEVGSGS